MNTDYSRLLHKLNSIMTHGACTFVRRRFRMSNGAKASFGVSEIDEIFRHAVQPWTYPKVYWPSSGS